MEQLLQTELEHNRKRLDYYSGLKEKTGNKVQMIDKWIAIYADRTKKVESKLQRLNKSASSKTQH